MKRKNYVIVGIVVLATAIGLGVLRMNDNPPTVTTNSNVTTPQEPAVTTQGDTTPAPANASVTMPVTPEQSTDTAETVSDAKTVSHDRILGDGWDDVQVQCFDMIMDKLYNWDVTNDEALTHVTNIENNYISFCAAWGMLTRYPNGYHPTI